MRYFLLPALVALLLAGSALAQPYGDGYFANGASYLHYVDTMGAVTSVSTGATHYAGIMNWDNRTALVFNSTLQSILEVDPKTLAVVGTFYTNTSLTSSTNVYGMCFDSNGDLYFANGTTAGLGAYGVYKVDQSKTLTTIISTTSFSGDFGGTRNIITDVDTGDLIVAVTGSSNVDPIYRLERDGSSYTTLGIGGNMRYGTFKHVLTGDIYSGTCCGSTLATGRSILWIKAGSGAITTFLNDPVFRGGYSPGLERASAANQRIISASWSTGTSGGIWYVDLPSKAPTQLTQIPRNTYDAVPVFGRNLQTVNTAKGKWDIRLSFPNHPGKSFVHAVSISGVRPFVPLPDGRNLPITPDIFTTLSLTTGLAPIITGNYGTLDASGEGMLKVDATPLGSAANGFTVFHVAAVIDPKASLGLAVISDPKVLVIEGL